MTEPLFAHREKNQTWHEYSAATKPLLWARWDFARVPGISSRGFGTHLRERWHQSQRATQHCEGLRMNPLGFCPGACSHLLGQRNELTAKQAVARVLLGLSRWFWCLAHPRAAGSAPAPSTAQPWQGRGRSSRQLGRECWPCKGCLGECTHLAQGREDLVGPEPVRSWQGDGARARTQRYMVG